MTRVSDEFALAVICLPLAVGWILFVCGLLAALFCEMGAMP